MSKINRIRLINLNYNGNTIRIDDEIFDMGGESTLLSLRNGGGKTVLVQMITSLFVNKKYRDTSERPFKSYFTTNRPTFILVEWVLDQQQGYVLTGMMVRKSQNTEENNSEDLDIIQFIGFYRSMCSYDLKQFPVIQERKGSRILKGFGECKGELEQLKKDKSADFDYYDMSVPNQRRAYFAKLREYQIYYREWETIIKKMNQKESGLSELFANAKDEKGLVEKWFLDVIEKKLNEETNRIKQFQELAYKFIQQYRKNQSKIKRKEIVEQYFEDAAVLEQEFSDYRMVEEELSEKKNEMAVFIRHVDQRIQESTERLAEAAEAVEEYDRKRNQVQWEQISCDIYRLQDEREAYLQKRLLSEERITRSVYARQETELAIGRLRCAKLYEEAEDFRKKISALKAEITVLMQENVDTEKERIQIGRSLYQYYYNLLQSSQKEQQEWEDQLVSCQKRKEENGRRADQETEQVKAYREICGGLARMIQAFDTAEDNFNNRYQTDFTRNLMGEYEEGLLAICQKKFEEEWVAAKGKVAKMAKEGQKLLEEGKRLAEEKEAAALLLFQRETAIGQLKEKWSKMQEEKQKRLVIMRFVEAPEEEIDAKELLLERLERKIEEAESVKDRYLEEQNFAKKEYENLSQGKGMELPENIAAFFEEYGVDHIYGMEWLKKNGRSVQENQRLVFGNPFLPYSIILNRRELKKFEEKEIYTPFPIPIIIREELEEALTKEKHLLIRLGGIHFLCLFNSHLLDKEELARLLAEKQKLIEELGKRIAAKKEELKEYRLRYDGIQNQSFTLAQIKETEKELQKQQKRFEELENEQFNRKEQQREIEKKQKENQENLRKAEWNQTHLQAREEAYQEFQKAYQGYCQSRQEQNRYQEKIREAEASVKRYREENKKLDNKVEEIRTFREESRRKTAEYQKELLRFEWVQEKERLDWEQENKEEKKRLDWTQGNGGEKESFEIDYDAMKARYFAITEGISKSIESLNKDFDQETTRYKRKQQELKRESEKYGLSEEAYQGRVFSEEEEERLERQLRDFFREENAAKEENIVLQTKLSTLAERLKHLIEKMCERTGYQEVRERKYIVETDFAARIKLLSYEKEKKIEEIHVWTEERTAFQHAQSVMAEYREFSITSETVGKELADITTEELNRYHGELRRDFRQLEKMREEKRQEAERLIQKLSEKQEYQEDFFAKGFANLLALAGDVYLATAQLNVILASYRNTLKKLEVDLEHVDRERKNVEDTFFDYVRDIHTHMQKIDKNSTIPVRGRSIKMLRIEVPLWEENQELYRVRMRDFVSEFIRLGIASIEKNENVEEFLGKVITTRRLYEEVVGIGNIGIRLYKIEAEREVAISWAEVSANSGGEGFLSAFVILICLLSYMRRDESEWFVSSEEGKVLIMDNPFAQTNAEHLLKPLIDMAKKTNTQLICLSELGGESIYNRFDNIYVIKLVQHQARTGVQYVRGEHRKGEEVQWMELSQVQVEAAGGFEMGEY